MIVRHRHFVRPLVCAAAMLAASCSPATRTGDGTAGPVITVPPTTGGPAAPATPAPAAALQWTTSVSPEQRLAPGAALAWSPVTTTTEPVIAVDPARQFQVMAGFGAAVTDSSAWLINNRLPEPQRSALIAELFGRNGDGLGFSVTRLTIGASDFSRTHYSLAEGPVGTAIDMRAVDADIVPVMTRARAANPDLFVIASPWSAPAAMKSTGSLIQGRLNATAYPAFATYLRDYVVGMQQRNIRIDALTIQNEPHFEPANYPGMRMQPPERAEFVGQHLGPLLASSGLSTSILEWDHNWDEPQSPAQVLRDATAARYISGVAWHCYAGDVAAQSVVRDEFPDKDVWFTECSGGGWAPDFAETLVWMTRNLVIGSTRHWARGVVMWNIALDENSGPHLGGCGNCRGVVTINSATGEVTRNVEYYVLGHASRFVRTGARRIASDSDVGGILSVAFRNADDGSRVVILLNANTASRRVALREGTYQTMVDMPAQAVTTVVWR